MQCGTGTRRGQSRHLFPLGFSEEIKNKRKGNIPKIGVMYK
jgi:hypothetical protein